MKRLAALFLLACMASAVAQSVLTLPLGKTELLDCGISQVGYQFQDGVLTLAGAPTVLSALLLQIFDEEP